MTKLSEHLLFLHSEQGLSQEKAAQAQGITYRSYRRYKSGECEPTASALVQTSVYYGVTLDYLAGRSEVC